MLRQAHDQDAVRIPGRDVGARVAGSWLGVVSPLAGNNRLGWIPAADASLSRVDWELRVSLAARRLTVLEARPCRPALHGRDRCAGRPTPTGRFAVTDRLLTGDPAGPYGCCILALSAKAPHAIQDWSGGRPDRHPLHAGDLVDRPGRQPRLHAAHARGGPMADRPHPARHPDPHQQLSVRLAPEGSGRRPSGPTQEDDATTGRNRGSKRSRQYEHIKERARPGRAASARRGDRGAHRQQGAGPRRRVAAGVEDVDQRHVIVSAAASARAPTARRAAPGSSSTARHRSWVSRDARR